jgi:hypothetical protein
MSFADPVKVPYANPPEGIVIMVAFKQLSFAVCAKEINERNKKGIKKNLLFTLNLINENLAPKIIESSGIVMFVFERKIE